MSQGWISLHRKITGHWLYRSEKGEPFDEFHAWIDILLSVNHKTAKVKHGRQFVVVKPGQMITSLQKLDDRWGWNNRTKTRRFLELLQSDGMVELETNKTGTLLTVVNWGFYQNSETQMTHNRNNGETLFTTNNNDNNVINKNSFFLSGDEKTANVDKSVENSEADKVWLAVLGVLKTELTSTAIETWFSDCYATGWDGETLTLGASSAFVLQTAKKHYGERINTIVKELKEQGQIR